MVNSADTREAARPRPAQHFAAPVLMDDLQLVGEQMAIQRDGEVFVLDPKAGFKVAYRGPETPAAPAIDAVLAGQPVANPRVAVDRRPAIAFQERARAAQFDEISYSKTIAPILQKKCVSCHQKGGIGPFQMNSYEVVKGFAPMMRESVMTRRMPPFFADPHVGKWSNDTSLTAEETKTLVHWIEAGAPRGKGEDILKTHAGEARSGPPRSASRTSSSSCRPSASRPAASSSTSAWQVDNPFKGDAWLRAVAFKPGARPVLHHITSNYSPDRSRPPADIPGSSVAPTSRARASRSTTWAPARRCRSAASSATRCTTPPTASR
jgi:hypothetical protein